MWPNLAGPGWQQQLVMAVGLLAAVFAALKALSAAADRLERVEATDPLLHLWHRYEVGDLTRHEFERAKPSLRAGPAAVTVDELPRAEVRRVPAS
jgi:hypothetical protein